MATRTALHKVFVYGTLKTGQPNNYLLKGPGVARLVGAAKLAQRYPLVVAPSYGNPCLLAKEGDGQVRLEASGVGYQQPRYHINRVLFDISRLLENRRASVQNYVLVVYK